MTASSIRPSTSCTSASRSALPRSSRRAFRFEQTTEMAPSRHVPDFVRHRAGKEAIAIDELFELLALQRVRTSSDMSTTMAARCRSDSAP